MRAFAIYEILSVDILEKRREKICVAVIKYVAEEGGKEKRLVISMLDEGPMQELHACLSDYYT